VSATARQRVLLAGVSVRALAESAARAGCDVTAIDAYGDLDLRRIARTVAAPRRDDGATPDGTLSIGIHDLSSLIVGSLRLTDLVRHRLASLEPRDMLAPVDAAFASPQPPFCATRF